MSLDRLEIELRLLSDVMYVGFAHGEDTVVVQVLADPGVDADRLRADAEQRCRLHLHQPFVVEVGGSRRRDRVRLLQVEPPKDDMTIVRLGYDGVCTAGRAEGTDPSAAANATFEALRELGATLPFSVEAAALFEHPVGDGVMIVLGSDRAGPRFGVASGSDPRQAAARATLHALNRYLSTQPLPATG